MYFLKSSICSTEIVRGISFFWSSRLLDSKIAACLRASAASKLNLAAVSIACAAMFVATPAAAYSSALSRDCDTSDWKLPNISTISPITKAINPSVSTGSNAFFSVFAKQRNSSIVGDPIIQRINLRNFLFSLHFTTYSALSSITPGITSAHPASASQVQPFSESQKEESIKLNAFVMECIMVVTLVALGVLALFAFVDFLIVCAESREKQRKKTLKKCNKNS